MKKIVVLLGLAATCFMFAGCSSYNNASEQPMAAPASEPAPAAPVHHDYKGEK